MGGSRRVARMGCAALLATIARASPCAAEQSAPVAATDSEAFRPWAPAAEGITLGGYAQGQYESHQDSQDQLFPGGAPQNKDRFDIRRARLNATGQWQWAAMALEMDANTVSGPQVDLRKAELSVQLRSPHEGRPPIASATIGLFDTPFGYEVVEVPRTRWFMEPSTATRALWPGSADLGIRFAGALGFFRWTVAVMNGQPIGEVGPYALQDPISAKDWLFRVGVDVPVRPRLEVAGDISSTHGKGFHPGTDTTKAALQWNDVNQDGVLQSNELVGIPGQTGLPSQTFERWALGADARIYLKSWLGLTKLYAEVVVASNMDRGLFVADPIVTGVDQRELGVYAGFVQEIRQYGVVGFRWDRYDPDSDAFDTRRARLFPYSQAITTFSPLVGLRLPQNVRVAFEYDFVRNSLGRDATGLPSSLRMDTWTLRIQAQL